MKSSQWFDNNVVKMYTKFYNKNMGFLAKLSPVLQKYQSMHLETWKGRVRSMRR
jgi:hypothetical protein